MAEVQDERKVVQADPEKAVASDDHGFDLRALDNDYHARSVDGSRKQDRSTLVSGLRMWGVESRGIYPVPLEKRTDPQFSKSFFVWLSCNLNILSFSEGTLGTIVYGLTFRQAAGVIVGFNLLAILPPAYFSTFGPKLGLRQMVQARYSFGWFGAIVPGVLNLLGMMGYNILNAILCGQTLSVVSGGRMSWSVGIVVISVISLLISFFGYRILNWYERVAWAPILIAYLVVLGVGGKHLGEPAGVPLAPPRAVLSYASTVAGFVISYAPLMSDYTNYMRPEVSNWRVFWFSYLGLFIPTVTVQLIGAAFAASLPLNPSWSEGYEANGAGGLIDAVLSPAGGFGKFLTTLLGLSVIANMGPTLYSFSISFQVVLPFVARVPRYVFSIFGTAVLIPLAIVGSTRFEETLVDFLGIVGYWSSTFVAVVIIEHVMFRRGDWSAYDLAAWNSARQLPAGIAAVGACVCAFGVIVPCMDQVWFVGPVAAKTGDIGFEVGFVVSGACYVVFRGVERRIREMMLCNRYVESGNARWQGVGGYLDRHQVATDDDSRSAAANFICYTMAAVQDAVDATTPRRRARRAINILVVANPDHSSSEDDTPASSAVYANYRPPTIRAPSPRPTRTGHPAASPRTIASPSPTSYVSPSGSSARSSNSPGPESTPPPPTPSHGLPPLDLGFAKPSHVTPNLPVGEDSDNQPESSTTPHVYPPHIRRPSDGTRAIQSPSTRRPFSPPGRHVLSPPQRTPSERIIVAVTHDAENYVVVDITGQTDAQAIRERILSKLHIPDDLHASFAIYRTELGGFAIGGALDNNQLLIDCQHFGDDRGSLKFLAQRADAPTDDLDIPVMPPSNAPVPPMLPSQSTFSPGAMRMPSMSRRTGSASPASDRLAPDGHMGGYEASVSAISDFDLPDSENTSPHMQTRSPIQTLHRQAASRRGRQPSSSSPIVRRQVRRRGSGSGTSDMSPVAPYPQSGQQALPSQSSSPDRVSSSSSLTATRPNERRGSVTPTPPATRSPPGRDANQFDDSAVASVVSVPAPNHARRPSEVDSAYERDLALAAEERRREEEQKQWQAKRNAEFQQKRQQWAMSHPGRVPPGEPAPAPGSNGVYNSNPSQNGGYAARGVVSNGMYPPQRTGSAHGRRTNEVWSGPEQQYRAYHAPVQQQPHVPVQQPHAPVQQPHAPVRQQGPESYYRGSYQAQQPARQSASGRQPSPQGGYGQPYANQQQTYIPQQQQQPPPQQPYPSQNQTQPNPNQYGPIQHAASRTLPPGPPRGAMLPRTPGAEYISQGQQAPWFSGGGAGSGYEQQPAEGQYRASGMGAGRPPSPQLRGGARSMGNLRSANDAQAPPPPPIPSVVSQRASTGGRGSSPSQSVLSPGMQTMTPGIQTMSPPGQPMSPLMSATIPMPHGSPLQHPVQQPLPPPSMFQYQQQQQHYARNTVAAPVEQRSVYIEPQRTGPAGYVEPQRTGPPSGYSEGGFGVIPTQNGQIAIPRPGERYDREREKEKEKQQEPVRSVRQQTGASPVPVPGYPASMPRPTSPRPAQGLSNWGSQSMNVVPHARLADASTASYYGANSNAAAMMAKRTFSGDNTQVQQRPQSTYDTSPNAMPSTLRPGMRPGARPLTDYENRPSPSELYRPPPLPQSQSQPLIPQQHSMSPPSRYTLFGSTGGMPDTFARRIQDDRADDLYGGMEEQSASPLSVNTSLLAPPPYEPELESASPSSVAGEVGQPSPLPLTPEPYHAELSESRTASPSASDASTVGYTGHTRDTDSDCDSTIAVSDTAEGTLKPGDYLAHMAAVARMVSGEDAVANGGATPPAPSRALSQGSIPSQPMPAPSAKIIPRDFALQEDEDEDEESDEDSGTLWQVPKQNSTPATSASPGSGTSLIRRTATRPKNLTVRIDSARPPSQTDSSPATQDSANATMIAPILPLDVRKKTSTNVTTNAGSGSGSDIPTRPPLAPQQSSNRGSQGWDIRPQAEEVYEHLDQFFPNHDLDKPVIEAPSGGTSPIATEAPPITGQASPATPALGPGVRRHKKSIRVVAAERQKMMERIRERVQLQTPAVEEAPDVPDSDSTIQPGTANILRKRSTKMWGVRLEEVRPGAASETKPVPSVPETIPEGRQRPTFKWVKGQLIGRGSFGRVYHAMNLTTGEMIAVKQVELPKTESDRNDSRQISVVEALKSESNTLRDLDHPHIVQYLGFEQTTDTLSIFLEYVPGGSVGSVLRKYGKFEDEVVRSFSHQIIDGLAYLHSTGILHRDLKGDNILVDRSGICKISDFGISKRSEHVYNNHEGTAMQGSVFWMAPEMLHSNKQGYNAKIDIWSVGCVVLEMQAGRRPWTEDDMFAVMYKVGGLRQAPPVPEDVQLTPLADDFRQKCFAVDPAERPTAAELLTHPWLRTSPGWVFTGFSK